MNDRAPSSDGLSDAELDSLDRFLATAGGDITSVEMLDGFLAAVIVGPELVLPSRCLPVVLGDPDDESRPGFASLEEAQAILSLLMRHWNAIAGILAAGHPYMPIVAEEEADRPGHEWAVGFLRGVDLTLRSWRPLMNDEQRGGPFVPIFMLAHEDDPDPELCSPEITPDLREEILVLVAAGLQLMYREHRKAPPPASRTPRARKTRRKPGR